MAATDYIIIGSGSAGAIIARRLADTGARVTLLEAGGRDNSRLVRKPGMIGPMHSVPQLKKRIDWGHYTVEQKHALGRRIPQTHGRVVGGSSSVNGMVFVRGNRRNFDDWAAAGNTGWAYEDVLPSFKKLESFEDGASAFRGGSGPIKVTRARDLTPASESFIRALTETAGIARNPDYNGAEQEGVSLFQQSNSNGLRFSTSVGYLDDRPKNLAVLPNTRALRVIVENGRAAGVEYTTGRGVEVLRAEREVIVSAGAFGSAQLLMLSGLGPADHLRAFGIDVVADLPVGDNLHDHLFVPMSFAMPTAVHRSSAGYFAGALLRESLRNNSTWLARTVFEAVAFLRTPYATGAPDLQLHVLPWSYPGPNQDAPIRHTPDPRRSLTVLVTMIYPQSRGTLRLTSADPTAPPAIDPNYLAEPRDLDTLVHGMELIREVMAAESIRTAVDTEISPGPAYSTRAALAAEVPNRATTVYHPVGTCRMGVDEHAVVDPTLRVRGVEGLRVADASIMPSIVGGNTNAATMMIGEHAAALITG
ncbi:FAD-dependent oxidoreductase [Nocardia yamanashiensis]|uniref:GMC family oxidoreductase n=1 Tax=Nocardia yamanashiensis TaxID=209247 RepID=UPI001E48ECBC|nr:FAD-dependent oxidoreductase [Nocardia yamanashiensis]UGT41638.1 FAD-dependent oxidoreductase [Nocardia yamanashiensis]